MIKLNSFLWIVPFFSFISGYLFLFFWFWQTPINTPNLIGCSLGKAAALLADHQLNLRIIGYKEETDIEPDIVINQIPQPGQSIRPNQPIFCLISKRAAKRCAPDCIGKPIESTKEFLQKNNIAYECYPVKSIQPSNTIIGQSPKEHQSLTAHPLILYYAAQEEDLFIIPNFKLLSIAQVRDIFCHTATKIQIIHRIAKPDTHQCADCLVVDQKPVSGSIIDVSKPSTIQLLVD